MKQRRRERRLALEILYEWDLTGRTVEEILKLKEGAGKVIVLSDFSERLVYGVQNYKEQLDKIIERYSEDWKVSRMPVVDRNILRLGTYELLFEADIPVPVSINEYIELAKLYGTDDSRRFINGILGMISKDLEKIKKEVDGDKKAKTVIRSRIP